MITRLQTLVSRETDPCTNLALEEYLTDTVPEGVCTLFLWQNRRTVVIGRNQNAWRECRTGALERDGGTLVRRLSGGGAVFHDLGNLNYTFCLPTAELDPPRQHSVVAQACRSLGVEVSFSGRNDMLAGGRKFSGSSFYSHAGRSFHNGTLLIDADMEKLERYLRPSPAKLASKGVESVRGRVGNLSRLCPGLTVADMTRAMTAAFSRVYALPVREMAAEELDGSAVLWRRARFADRAWTYGSSKPFTFSASARFDWGEITVQLAVERGRCADAAVFSDAMDAELAPALAGALRDCPFTADALCARVRGCALCAPCAHELCSWLAAQDI